MADPLPNSLVDTPAANPRPQKQSYCVVSTVEDLGVDLSPEEQTAIQVLHSFKHNSMLDIPVSTVEDLGVDLSSEEQTAIQVLHSLHSFEPNSMLDIPTDNSCLQSVMRPEHKPQPHCVLSTVEELGVHRTTEEQTAIKKMHSLTKRTFFRSVGDTRVWHPAVESSLIRGFIAYEEKFGDYERSKGYKKTGKRNKFISAFIMEETKEARTPEQIGSRLQQIQVGTKDVRNLHALRLPVPKVNTGRQETTSETPHCTTEQTPDCRCTTEEMLAHWNHSIDGEFLGYYPINGEFLGHYPTHSINGELLGYYPINREGYLPTH
ncbi:hypothetical protein GGX14DRAFT_576149 [Mycena pura]|uniref:TEA domain-containing protein n=1 Tax=Mycena pura TaxID=153505 RepID=A0AAD6V122_9AGAR|nr:hypothetical protein GGX14DRAFT_576149 [Mycena pura]